MVILIKLNYNIMKRELSLTSRGNNSKTRCTYIFHTTDIVNDWNFAYSLEDFHEEY